MAKKSAVNRNERVLKLVKQYAEKRAALKRDLQPIIEIHRTL